MANWNRNVRGLTLVELLICIAILTLSFSLASHGIPDYLNHSRIVSTLNNISSGIQYAKLSAISEEVSATVCPAKDGRTCNKHQWSDQIIVFEDRNNNLFRDKDEQLLHYVDGAHENIVVRSKKTFIRFHQGGVTATPASIFICTLQGKELTRGLTISLQGRVRLSKDGNLDGIHEHANGNDINCIV